MNLSVPLDRRVWLEALALVAEGRPVSVICPRGESDLAAREELSGVRIYRFRPPPPALGVLGYVREFVVSWLRAFGLTLVVFVRDGFAAVQACNPPDTLFAVRGSLQAPRCSFRLRPTRLVPGDLRSRASVLSGGPSGVCSSLWSELPTPPRIA